MQPPKNANYCAVVADVKSVMPLPKCDKIQGARLFGTTTVIVGLDVKPGDRGIYFPPETALAPTFLAVNNLYNKPEYGNVDPNARRGYFEKHGRVRTIKFRGNASEGFWLPLAEFPAFAQLATVDEGTSFDELDGQEICWKYVPKRNPSKAYNPQKPIKKPSDDIKEGQFRLHYDTHQLRRNAHAIQPDDIISISEKEHGTSGIFANLPIKRKLNMVERVLKFLRLPVQLEEFEFGPVYSSRKVIKGVGANAPQRPGGYYVSPIWQKVNEEIGASIPPGYTVYAEIVGYMENGGFIQKGYHYGCQPGEHKTRVYRVTITTADGKVHELTVPDVKAFCAERGLETVTFYYYGPAKGRWAYDETTPVEQWQESLVRELEGCHVGGLCHRNNNEVPAEGIVVRVDENRSCRAYKLKSFEFLERETKMLDAGEEDIEEMESQDSAMSNMANYGETLYRNPTV